MRNHTSVVCEVNDFLDRQDFTRALTLLADTVLTKYSATAREMVGDNEKHQTSVETSLKQLETCLNDIIEKFDKAEPAILAVRNAEVNELVERLLSRLNDIDGYTSYHWPQMVHQVTDKFGSLARSIAKQLETPLSSDESARGKKLLLGEEKVFLRFNLRAVKPSLADLIYASSRVYSQTFTCESGQSEKLALLKFFLPASDDNADLQDRLVEGFEKAEEMVARVSKVKEDLPAGDRDLLTRIEDDLYPSIFNGVKKADLTFTEVGDRRAAAGEAVQQFAAVVEGLKRIIDREAAVVLAELKEQTALISDILTGEGNPAPELPAIVLTKDA